MKTKTLQQIVRVIERDTKNLAAAIDTTFDMPNGEAERDRIDLELQANNDALTEIHNFLNDLKFLTITKKNPSGVGQITKHFSIIDEFLPNPTPEVLEQIKALYDSFIKYSGFKANNELIFKGILNCSENPNYPQGNENHLYIISLKDDKTDKVNKQGRIGGVRGKEVIHGQSLLCIENSLSGSEEEVGSKWIALPMSGYDVSPLNQISQI